MRLRSAARCVNATSRRRTANHSTCCSLTRSHGGLPITASNPPVGAGLFRSVQTPGNAACQLRKRSSAIRPRARANNPAKRAPSGMSSATVAVSCARAIGSPRRPSKKACSAALSSRVFTSSQSKACSTDRKASSGAVRASTSAKVCAERCASAISASVRRSMVCMAPAASAARFTGSWMNRPWPCAPARSMPWRAQQPNRLSPRRRWWSRKLSGAPTVKVCSHSETLASSTAIGFLSTP